MVWADKAHTEEERDDPEAREARDKAFQALGAKVIRLREILAGIYGGQALAALSIKGKTPVEPIALERFAGELATVLQREKLPEPQMENPNFKRGEEASALMEMSATLKQARDKVAQEVREAETTAAVKNTQIARYDQSFGASARLLESLYELIGQDAWAHRVRPSTTYPGQTQEQAPTPDEDPTP